jgi:hypothetical protein
MASRLGEKARKKKLEETAAIADASVRRREAVQQQLAPTPAPVRQKKLSDSIKETLNQPLSAPSSTPRTSVLDPPPEPKLPETVSAITTYNPQTQRHAVEVKTPEDIRKDIIDVTPSPTKTLSTRQESVTPTPAVAAMPTVPTVQRYEYVYNPETKTRTRQLVTVPAPTTSEERKTAIAEQAAKIVGEREKISLTEAERLETQKAMQDRREYVEKLGLDPSRKYTASYLQEIEKRQKDPFKPVLEGLTFVADEVITNVLPILGGAAGAVVSQAYKNFAPPTSKFYQDVNFEDKVVNFLADNAQDKAKDLLMGQLKGIGSAAKTAAQGYRRVGTGRTSALSDRLVNVQEASTKIPGGTQFTAGVGNIRGAAAMGTKPDFGSASVGPLAKGAVPVPKALVSPRQARGVVRPVART